MVLAENVRQHRKVLDISMLFRHTWVTGQPVMSLVIS
jgi:hypothetical protein